MMNAKIRYEFSAVVWQYASPGGWYFISIPQEISKEIRENLKWMEEGWGRLKVVSIIGNSEWETAIWFDTKYDTYILPLKAEIRNRENLKINQELRAIILI